MIGPDNGTDTFWDPTGSIGSGLLLPGAEQARNSASGRREWRCTYSVSTISL